MGLVSVISIVLAVFLVDIKDEGNLRNKPEKNFSIPRSNQLTHSSSGQVNRWCVHSYHRFDVG